MSNKTLFLGIIIIIVMAAFVIYNPNKVENKRRPVSDTNTTSTSDTFESRLKNADTSNLETSATPITELQTQVIAEGSGDETVATGQRIRVNYRGWLASNGQVFDQSFDRGDEGFTFTVGSGVIVGWSQGVVGMKEGEVRRLKIPSSLGYGEGGAGDAIPANADLIFDVELIEIL